MKNEKVLITGCGGMLGNAIYPYFIKRYSNVLATDKDVNEEWLEYLDVREHDKVQQVFEEFQPEIVLHLAAETDLEFCETFPDIAEATNSTATKKIAQLSNEYNATLVYISTAGVFDGEKEGNYTEADAANPIMVYGDEKYNGEVHVRSIADKYFILRAGWMVGGGNKKDHKFVMKILEQIIDGKKTLNVVTDKWGTPTYTHDFALNLFELLKTTKYDTYHMVCEGSGTRFDVAKEILNICGRNDIKMIGVDSDFFKEEYFAPRPRSEMMINENLRAIGMNHMRPWKVALNEYLNLEFSHAIVGGKQNVISVDEYNGVERRIVHHLVSTSGWDGIERRENKVA